MGADRIKGITIEINGNTTKLTSALQGVNKSLNASQKALRDVNKLLKFDPSNTELLRQKQDYLQKSVSDTEEKLRQEKEALAQLRDADTTEDTTEQQRALERQIADTEAQLKNFKGQLSDFGSVGAQQVAAVGAKFEEVGQKMQDVGKTLNTHLTVPILALGTASVAAFNDVDKGMDAVVLKTGATGAALQNLQEIVKSIATSIPTSFETAGNAVGEVNTRFEVAGKDLEQLSTLFIKFAEINNVDVVSAVDNVQMATAAWGLTVKDVPALLDTLTVASQKSGVSVDRLAALMAENKTVLSEMGYSASDSAMFLAQLEKNGVDTSGALAGLKKALANAAKDGKSMDEALAELQDTLANASSDSEAYAAAMELFGAKAGPQLADAIQSGRLSLDELGTSLKDNLGAVNTTFENTLDAPDKLAVAFNNLKVTGAELGSSLFTVAGPILEKLSAGAQKLATWFSGLDDKTKNIIVTVAALAVAVGPVLSFGGRLVSGVGTILSLAPKIANAISKISTVLQALGGLIAAHPVVAGITAVIAIIAVLWTNCEGFRNWVTGALESIGAFFTETIPGWFNGIKEGLSELGANIGEKFTAAKDAVVGAWTSVKEHTAEAWENIKAKVEENGGGIQGILATAGQAFLSIWSGAFNAIDAATGGRLSNALATVRSKVDSIKAAFSEKLGAARDKVKEIIDKIKGFFNFTVSLPKIKLPHFAVSPKGWSIGDLLKGSIPSLSIDWYKRAYNNPIVFNHPTVIPTPDGLKGFGDGNGAEVVIGLNRLRELVAAGAGGGDVYNNYHFNVYAARGQSEEAIADAVIRKLTFDVNRKR